MKLKNILLATLLSASALIISNNATAQMQDMPLNAEENATKHKNHKPRKDKFIAMSHFSRLLHKIDFTTEQKNKIAEIMQNNKASMSEKYKDLHNLYKQFDDVKFNQNFDSNKAQILVKQIAEKRIEIDLEDFNIEKQIYEVLNKEQQQQIKKLYEEEKSKQHNRKNK